MENPTAEIIEETTASVNWWVVFGVVAVIGVILAVVVAQIRKRRKEKDYERSLKMVPMLIHLPPSTDDIQVGGRDERDVTNEAISEAQVMYSIIASTLTKGLKSKVYGQRHMSFEMVATDGLVKYYAVVPAVLTETVKQAVVSAYPAARLEEVEDENIFAPGTSAAQVAGGELSLKKDYVYPIATYEETKWDGQGALLNAFSQVKDGEGMCLQILFRPAREDWIKKATSRVQNIRDGKKSNNSGNVVLMFANLVKDVIKAPFAVPEAHEYDKNEANLTQLDQEEIAAIEDKIKSPGFECQIRVIASSGTRARSEALVGGVVAACSQFDSQRNNGFHYDMLKNVEQLAIDYIFRFFPVKNKNIVLNSVELASLFHLPSQNAIPSSGVERQLTKQVDGPARLVQDGVLIGINKYRGVEKEIRLSTEDRRRHVYVIGSTGMGKSVFLRNIAYQDMIEGRGFAFIDPHGDVADELLSMVPEDRIDDVIYFDPSNIDYPMGMNMLEFSTPDQKDFIVQEGINMLQSLYDPTNQGFFGPRGQHMFRNAALLLMSDPKGATFIDIPKCFIDPEFVKEKLQYVTDRNVYDYWTKEFPESQKSNDAGEVITWFSSKWGPFQSNTMMKNTLGQIKSAFNIRDIMDNKKILLVNLSKGKLGELNSKLLGMIFVMKFQAAAMSRVDTPEEERNDFCLFVDEFQNFSTESFESILSEARKFRLNLVVANQFMTQLTDKIREGVIGNVGTIVAGRLGVTDAELMEKVFTPVFNAEDLHKTPNHNAIATVMMYGMPSSPFTMTWPMLGETKPEVMESLKLYSATKYGRSRAEVEKEIDERMAVKSASSATGGEVTQAPQGQSFLDSWAEKKAQVVQSGMSGGEGGSQAEQRDENSIERADSGQAEPSEEALKMAAEAIESLEKGSQNQKRDSVQSESEDDETVLRLR